MFILLTVGKGEKKSPRLLFFSFRPTGSGTYPPGFRWRWGAPPTSLARSQNEVIPREMGPISKPAFSMYYPIRYCRRYCRLLPLPPFPRADIDGPIITGCGYQLITGSLGDLEDRDFDHRSFPKNLPQTNIANRHLKHCQLFSIVRSWQSWQPLKKANKYKDVITLT